MGRILPSGKKIYSFVAYEKKDEMILGLGFSTALILPLLLFSTLAWYFIPVYRRLSKGMSGFGFGIAIPPVIVWLLLLHLIKRITTRQFKYFSEKAIIFFYNPL